MCIKSSKRHRRRGAGWRLMPYALLAAAVLLPASAAAQTKGSVVPGTDVVIPAGLNGTGDPVSEDAAHWGQNLEKLHSLYNGCSQEYEATRELHRSTLKALVEKNWEVTAARHQADGNLSLTAWVRTTADAYRRLIGWLPPAKLSEPCPPENPPAFSIAGTGIKLYDFELAAKWSQKLAALRGRQTTCSGYPVLLRNTQDELEADAAAREKALGGSLAPATRASLEADRDGLKQLGETISSPCVVPPRATPGMSVQQKPKATKPRASARTRAKKKKPKRRTASQPLDRDTARAVEFGIGVGLGILSNQGNRGGQNRQQNWNNQ